MGGVIPMAELERRAILHAYDHTGGNATKASKLLGISRATLYRRLGQYGVLAESD
jgi:transcriptional regulator of acetoin/glycerol metabolism